ncbi:MAG: hypothetical protein ACO37W_02535, partial [Prochlorotrichaceae cyanobacterium]
ASVSFRISAPANNDTIDVNDDGEQVILTLTASDADEYDFVDPDNPDSVTVTIRDRNDKGNINLSATQPNGTENGTPIIFTLTRTGDNLQFVDVNYTLTGDTIPSDYTIDVYTYAYTLDNNGTPILDNTGNVVLTPTKLNDAQKLTFFRENPNYATATSGSLRLDPFPTSTNFDPALNPTTGQLIPQRVDIYFTPFNDLLIEPDEAITLTLTESTNTANNYTVGSNQNTTSVSATGRILQDSSDTISEKPIVEVVATDSTAFEEGSTSPNGVFTFQLKGRDGVTPLTLTQDLTLNFELLPESTATLDTDYTLESINLIGTNSIVVPAGSSSVTLVVAPQTDTEIESFLETVELRLTGGNVNYDISSTKDSDVVTIGDNEKTPTVPTLSISAVVPTASEGTLLPGKFRITRTYQGNLSDAKAITGITLSVPNTGDGIATPGSDYNFRLVGSTQEFTELKDLVIPSATEFIEIEVVPKKDNVVDLNETVTATITGGSPTTYLIATAPQNTATVRIQDANVVSGITVSVELMIMEMVKGIQLTKNHQQLMPSVLGDREVLPVMILRLLTLIMMELLMEMTIALPNP